MPHERFTGLTDLLRKLISRDDGFRSSELKGRDYTTTKILSVLKRLARQGEAFPVQLSHKNTRWYATQAAADAALAKSRERQKQGFTSFDYGHARLRTSSREWQEAQPVITPDTKISICQGYTPRFQALEMPGLHGGLQRGRVVRGRQ